MSKAGRSSISHNSQRKVTCTNFITTAESALILKMLWVFLTKTNLAKSFSRTERTKA